MKSNKLSFLSTTDKVSEAFPDILSLNITVTQDPYGYYAKRPEQRTSYYSLDNLPPLLVALIPDANKAAWSFKTSSITRTMVNINFRVMDMKEHPKAGSKAIHVITLSK